MGYALAGIGLLGALALTACGASVDPVAKAADKAVSKNSERVSFRGTVFIPGSPNTQMTGMGDFQSDPKLGKAHLAIEAAGRHVVMDEVLRGSTIYMKSPLFSGRLPNGKQWLYLDLHKANALGINLNAFSQQSPADTLQALEKAGSVTKVGEETIDGQQTTHYKATVDFAKIPNGAQVQKLTQLKAAPVDVWIGAGNLLRRLKLSYSTNAAGSKMSATTTMDFTNYGEQVDVQVPPAEETVDMTKLGG